MCVCVCVFVCVRMCGNRTPASSHRPRALPHTQALIEEGGEELAKRMVVLDLDTLPHNDGVGLQICLERITDLHTVPQVRARASACVRARARERASGQIVRICARTQTVRGR